MPSVGPPQNCGPGVRGADESHETNRETGVNGRWKASGNAEDQNRPRSSSAPAAMVSLRPPVPPSTIGSGAGASGRSPLGPSVTGIPATESGDAGCGAAPPCVVTVHAASDSAVRGTIASAAAHAGAGSGGRILIGLLRGAAGYGQATPYCGRGA